MKFLRIVLVTLSALILVAVLISLLPTDAWFVRTVDLVREPMSWIALLLLLISLFALSGKARSAAAVMFTVAIVINVWRIWPYIPLAGTQIALEEPVSGDRCFTALAVNVKVKNTGYAQVAEQIRSVDPDVLFLMETDQRWVNELAGVTSAYAHVDTHPQPEAFGMVFASRVPVTRSNIVENTHRDTPTLYATLQPEGGNPVEFIGLHPKPPLPDWNTEERDENIVNAATQTPGRLPDAITMGDFNDVPWSRTTSRFRDKGEWRDPRTGRGTYPTFPADYTWAGWPLDQLMVKGDIKLRRFEVMPDNGSDHRAMLGEFCIGQASAPG